MAMEAVLFNKQMKEVTYLLVIQPPLKVVDLIFG